VQSSDNAHRREVKLKVNGISVTDVNGRPSRGQLERAEQIRRSPNLIPFIVFFLAFVKWMARGRDPEEGSVEVQFDPVDGASPAELGTLVDNTADMRDITATLVDLAVRGFIRIEETAQSEILGLGEHAEYIIHIVKKHAEWIGLRPHEIRVLGALSSASPFDPFTVAILKDTIAQFPTFSEGFGYALRTLPDETTLLGTDHCPHARIVEPAAA